MLVERSTHPQFLSNTYLVIGDDEVGAEPARQSGGSPRRTRPALFVDAGGPVGPLIASAERRGVTPTHVLLTHHHHDHVAETAALQAHWPGIEVLLHPIEAELVDQSLHAGPLEAGDVLSVGSLEVRPLRTPGHTAGMLSLLINDHAAGLYPPLTDVAEPETASFAHAAVFTGDTLFKDSVGGLHAPGHTSYQDLKDSIMGTLMELDGETVIYPGHAHATTVAREWDRNPFIRVWRRLDREGSRPCVALGQPATLVLWAGDYDGGHKAWVRWPDGSDDIVAGSKVRAGG
jgi:glyoxylase-like metal-dependent hydrolase (beta-lactamase superfamily II)